MYRRLSMNLTFAVFDREMTCYIEKTTLLNEINE